MENIRLRIIVLFGFFLLYSSAFSQCEIKNLIYPDGSILYFIEPVNFYRTEKKSLKGGIVTDKENYYLALQPIPFPDKSVGKKLKSDLLLTLEDGKEYVFEHFDTRYLERDSVMQMLYLINNEGLGPLQNFEVVFAKIDMLGDEGTRIYDFKLHKHAIIEQLKCFREVEEYKKK